MFAVFILAIGLLLAIAATGVAAVNLSYFHYLNDYHHEHNIQVVSSAIMRQAQDEPRLLSDYGFLYPDSNNKAINTELPQWAYLRTADLELYEHPNNTGVYRTATATGVMNSGFQASRMALWIESPINGFDGDAYVNVNPCKRSGDTATGLNASQWCGTHSSIWSKLESGTIALRWMESEQQRLYRLSRKFFRYYSGARDFLGVTHRTGVTPVNQSLPLYEFTNAPLGLSAESCDGVYWLRGEGNAVSPPLDCNELFNAWGKPIYLNIQQSNRVQLVNILGIEHSGPVSGNTLKPVRFSEDVYIRF